jgi:hypothetical protein
MIKIFKTKINISIDKNANNQISQAIFISQQLLCYDFFVITREGGIENQHKGEELAHKINTYFFWHLYNEELKQFLK